MEQNVTKPLVMAKKKLLQQTIVDYGGLSL
jgi:hypothetical protein